MIDEEIEAEFEALVRVALHEMIPKAELAARSAAGTSFMDESPTWELTVRPTRATDVHDEIGPMPLATGARRRRRALAMTVVATAALVVVLISLAVIRDPNTTTDPTSAPPGSGTAADPPDLFVYPSGGPNEASAAGFVDPTSVVAAYLGDRTDPSRLPAGYEMAATVGEVRTIDDDTAVVSIHLQTTGDSGDGLVAVQRVAATSGPVWLVTAAAVFTDELLDVRLSSGQLTGRFISSAGGQTYFDAYDASTGVLIDSTVVTLPVLSGNEVTRPEAAFALDTGPATVVALRYWNIVDPVNAYAFANFAEVPVMNDTPGVGAGWVELQRIRTPVEIDTPTVAAVPPVKFETPTVRLEASSVQVIAGEQTFSPTTDVRVDGDPGMPNEYTTLELTWHEGDIEQRINMYFTSDGTHWWANEIRTYNGQPDGDWIEPTAQGQYFKSPLGVAYRGDLDLPNLHIQDMTLEAFHRPAACDDESNPVVLIADYPVIDSWPGGFSASFQLLDPATCTAIPVEGYTFVYTSDDHTIAAVQDPQDDIADYSPTKAWLGLQLVNPGTTTIHATATDAAGNMVGTVDVHVTVRAADQTATHDTSPP